MLAESRQVDVHERSASLIDEMTEVRGRAQIAYSSVGTITAPSEQSREGVNVRSARSAPQVLQHPWSGKICLQHFVSPLVSGHQRPSLSRALRPRFYGDK